MTIKLPDLCEQLHRIATLDPEIWRTKTQESFKVRRGATTRKQILDVMLDLGSKNVRSLDIEQRIGLSRGGCLKQLRRMACDGIVTKNSACCRKNTWSIHDKFMNDKNERN